MGRVFEKRKHTMFARYDRMAKAFTRCGKEIAMAVKEAGPNPEYNSRLRMAIRNAKAHNMPKDRVEAAIKRASSKEEKDFEEVIYEGYGPHGVAIVVETATDNPTRTVANIRKYFSRNEGTLGKSGSLEFLFERKGVFKIAKPALNAEELELTLIDHGLEEMEEGDDGISLYTAFNDFGNMQKGLEEKGLQVIKAEKQRFPVSTVDLTEDQLKQIETLIQALEEDDDVQAVYHNIA